MHIAILSSDSSIAAFLSHGGHTVTRYQPDAVPSLTRLIFDNEEISALVIQDGETALWSGSHVITAARQLERRGPTILLGGGKITDQCVNAKAVLVAKDKTELTALLRRKPQAADGGRSLTPADTTPIKPVKPVQIPPLSIPAGKILFLGVVGSQRRIGCTTQAIGLWHYCKALGFDPAVVSSPEQIAQIAGTMRHDEIDSGFQVEKVPFVTSTALAYDCYILDIGPGSIPDALKNTDCLVLVAGSKPWELQHTTAALRAAQGRKMEIILSFTSPKDASVLQPLFGGQTAIAAPWMPDLWTPVPEALAAYELLLRPTLERLLSAMEPFPEQNIPELMKEVIV